MHHRHHVHLPLPFVSVWRHLEGEKHHHLTLIFYNAERHQHRKARRECMNSCLGPGPKLLAKSNPIYCPARLGRSEETVAGELLYGGRRGDWDTYHEASRLLKVM